MSFFDSEVVKAEMTQIHELQEDIYKNVFEFGNMQKDQKLKHVEVLEKLLEKQRILYCRLSLSDDPEAKEMKQRIFDSAKLMGLPSDGSMQDVFSSMATMLEAMRKKIDNTGTDL